MTVEGPSAAVETDSALRLQRPVAHVRRVPWTLKNPRLAVWPPLPPDVYLRRPARRLPFPLEEPDTRLLAWGRHGLHLGVRALGLGAGDEILVPAYHHGSEVQALIEAGLVCRFYEATDTLAPDERELDELLAPRVRALHLTHFFGFPQDSLRWRRWCDERGLLLIEDAAQAWLASREGRPVGSLGDLSIFCLYKTFGIPEGAAVVVRGPPPEGGFDQRYGVVELARRHGAWLAARSGVADLVSMPFRRALRRPYDVTLDFALRELDSRPWASTNFLLHRLAGEDAAARRRAHYRLLIDQLREHVPTPFDELPEGASPFAFPITTVGKQALLDRLKRQGVVGLDFWSVPHPALDAPSYPAAAARRATTIALPVHQELRVGDLERIVHAVRGRAPRDEVRTELTDDIGGLRAEWTALAAGGDNVFATWEWASTWWRHFGAGRPVMVAACRRPDDRLLAIFPLYQSSRSPLRVLRFIGHLGGDRLGPVCRPNDVARAARALRRFLGAHADLWQVLLGERLPADQGWSDLLDARVLRREGDPVMDLRGLTWDEYLSTRSANFRSQVRSRERRLQRGRDVRIRLTADAERLQEDLETMFRLHADRWRGRDHGAFSGGLADFHRDFAAAAFQRGWLRLWTLELDEEPVAAWYGFRFGRTELFYQSGRDMSRERESVGFVLLAHTIREAMQDGLREYRFSRGAEGYKSRFTDTDPGLETFALARGAIGRSAGFAAGTAFALPARSRQQLARLVD